MKVMGAECEADGKGGPLGEMVPGEEATVTGAGCPENVLALEEAGDGTAAAAEDPAEGRRPARRFERVPIALPVIGRAPQFLGTPLRGIARYIGGGGMMIEFSVELVHGTLLRVVLPTPRGPLEVEGEIVWTTAHESRIRHGLAFPVPKDPAWVARVVEGQPQDAVPERAAEKD